MELLQAETPEALEQERVGGGWNFFPFATVSNVFQRVKMRISPQDHKRAVAGKRDWGHTGEVTDLDTGKQYEVKARLCQVPGCWCEREVREIVPAGPVPGAGPGAA